MTFDVMLRRRTGATQLRAAWATRAVAALDLPRTAWEGPAGEAITEALAARTDPLPAVRRLAEHRAAIGLTLDEAVLDLGLLAELLSDPSALDNVSVGLAVAEVYTRGEPAACTEPLTHLPNAAYLAVRIDEVRRAVAHVGVNPADHLGLVCVQLPRPTALGRSVGEAMAVADSLRRSCRRGETVAAISSRLFVVLVADGRGSLPVEGLPPGASVWFEPIPDATRSVADLLEDLAQR